MNMRFANEFGFCELNSFPGNSQIVVSNHAFVYPIHRGQGKGKENHIKRTERSRDLGYDYVMCTVIASNTRELAIIKKERWKELDRFKNTVTGNEVIIFGKHLLREIM